MTQHFKFSFVNSFSVGVTFRSTLYFGFAILAGCSGSGGGDFAKLDSPVQGADNVACKIIESTPTVANTKVAALSGTKTIFSVTPSTGSCKIFYFLNGVKINAKNTTYLEMDSNLLIAGSNTLKVEANNDLGSDSHEWTITKNLPPTCARVLPVTSTLNLSTAASQSFTASTSTEPGESLSFRWLLDGAESASLSETITSTNASQAQLSGSGLTGVKQVQAVISDGLDSTTCAWTVNVGADCSLTGKTPNVASLRVPASAGFLSNYSVATSTPTCLISWTLNGADLTGNDANRTLTSHALSTGSNILKAEVTSSGGNSSQIWTVVKNTPPTCSQTPSATGAMVSAGNTLNLQADLNDVNSDPLTWIWSLNGLSPSSPPVTITNGTNTTTAAFVPTSANIGYNSFSLNMSDGYDSATCQWAIQVNPRCGIASQNPASNTTTIASLSSTMNVFSVVPTDSSCAVSWSLNGINLGTNLTIVNLLSSTFSTNSTLTATVANSSSSQTSTWNITKNTPPVCAAQSPSSGGVVLGVGATPNFVANLADPNAGQTLAYDWRLDGAAPSATYFSSTSTALSATGNWTLLSNQVGSHNLSVNVSDSYDSTTCSWPVSVLRNCSVASSSPIATTLKVANLASTFVSFGVVANDPSCSIEWKLNGTSVASGFNFKTFFSSDLSSTNTLVATLANAVSSVDRSWTINKNHAPLCASQSPAASGNSVNIGSSQIFNTSTSDADSDALNYVWTLDSAASSTITGVTNSTYTSAMTFQPGLGQVGTGHTLKLTMDDGYDSQVCVWAVDVVDPSSAQILSWSPAATPVVILSNDSKDLTVNASGTGLTYKWFLDGTQLSGKTTASVNFASTDMTVGDHSVKVVVKDTYNNVAEHTFPVKRNAKPVITLFTPNVTNVTNYRVNYNSTFGFNISASDANADVLTYTWTLDNGINSALVVNGGATTATYAPSGNTLMIGPHTVQVTVSDGYESVSQSWPVTVNYFSSDCNDLYNSNPLGSNGGRVCTLVGSPSMGHTLDIQTDPTLLKSKPFQIIELETGVFAFSDQLNHTVNVYNSNTNGATKSYFGQSIPPKTVIVALGVGAQGRNNDASTRVPAFQNTGSPAVLMPSFKLYEPRSLAYDSVRGIIYVADRYNHRVVALDSSGQVFRVLGLSGGSTTQNSITNQNDIYGYNSACSHPLGLTISGRYLYTGCYGQHAIKRTNIDNPSDTANYSVTRTVVGRTSTTYANNFSPIANVSADGSGGNDFTPASGAVAYANNIIDLASDNAGMIYWLELQGNNQGLRLRAYNTNSSGTVTFYANPSSNHVSLASFSLQAFDLATSGTVTATNFTAQVVNATAGTLSALGVQIASRIGQNSCHLVNIRLLNGTTPITLASTASVALSLTSGTGSFYTDSACAGGTTTTLSIAAGNSQGNVWLKPTAAGSYVVSATSGGFTSTGSSTSAVIAATGFSTIVVTAAPRFKPNECVPVEFTLAAATGAPVQIGAARYVAPTTNNYGSYYNDSNCSTVIDRIAFGPTDSTKFAYFKRTVTIPAGWTGSLVGYNNSPGNFGDYTGSASMGYIRFLANPSSLDVIKNNSTGLPDAIVYASNNGNFVGYVNFTNTSPNLARSIAAESTEVIFALPNSTSAPTSISGSGTFNGDDAPAWGSALNTPTGVRVNLAQTQLLIGDTANARGRTMDLNAVSYAHTNIGAGRARDRVNVTTLAATDVAISYPYKADYFNGSIYFSEYNNHRIRRVSLTTGIVDVIAGNGATSVFTEGNDATAEGMKNPRGFKVFGYPTALNPTNYVLAYAETCQVRAVNLSGPAINNFFGVGTLLPGKVKTIAGDTSNGCATWSSFNTDGMAAINARLNTPEDVAFIDGMLYIISASDHCLLTVASDGTIRRPQGASSCSTTVPTSNDSTMDSMRTRYPKAFTPDTAHPGNYFFIDQYADLTGFIRYFNVLTSAFTFKNTAPVNVPARASTTASIPVSTVYQYTAASGSSGIGGAASWTENPGANGLNDKVCWTAGVLSDGSNGAHAIYCANRNQDDDGTLAAGPSNGSGIRGGAPLNREQEKIGRLNATFYSPYGIAFDDEGNLYVTEYNNHIIRMIRRWW